MYGISVTGTKYNTSGFWKIIFLASSRQHWEILHVALNQGTSVQTINVLLIANEAVIQQTAAIFNYSEWPTEK